MICKFNLYLVIAGMLLMTAAATQAGTIVSSNFNGVTNGAVDTTNMMDWGYIDNDADLFNGSSAIYSNTNYDDLTDGASTPTNLTTVDPSPAIGAVTVTEIRAALDGRGDGSSSFSFDGNSAFGVYGSFPGNAGDIWSITFNDLGIGTRIITLYLGHSANNRQFDMDVSLDDGGSPVTTTTSSGVISGLGSSVAFKTGVAFTYDIEVETTTASADLTLTFASVNGSAGEGLWSGYTVIPEPASLILLGLGSTIMLARRRK